MSSRRKGPCTEPVNRSLDAVSSSHLAVRSSCGQAVNECTCPFANSTTTGPFANTSYVERNGRRYKVILEPVVETTKSIAPYRRHSIETPGRTLNLLCFRQIFRRKKMKNTMSWFFSSNQRKSKLKHSILSNFSLSQRNSKLKLSFLPILSVIILSVNP